MTGEGDSSEVLEQVARECPGLPGRFSHIRCAERGVLALGAGSVRSLVDVGCNALRERDGLPPFLQHFML
jgi:hypothetical protein